MSLDDRLMSVSVCRSQLSAVAEEGARVVGMQSDLHALAHKARVEEHVEKARLETIKIAQMPLLTAAIELNVNGDVASVEGVVDAKGGT